MMLPTHTYEPGLSLAVSQPYYPQTPTKSNFGLQSSPARTANYFAAQSLTTSTIMINNCDKVSLAHKGTTDR